MYGANCGATRADRRYQERLLDCESARQHGMGYAVGENNPRRERRKLHSYLWAILLKLAILFQVIVEPQHEHVVRRASESAEAEFRSPILHGSANESVILGDLAQSRTLCMRASQRSEILRGVPHARLLAI